MLQVILVLLFALAVIVFGPLASLWALNTLFPVLAIPYTFDTWAASLILGGVLSGGIIQSRK